MSQFAGIMKYEEYNARMAKSIMDKLFFLDKVDADVFVDFGCADGTLIRYMLDWLPGDTRLIGYDNDPKMAQTAWEKFCKMPLGDRIDQIAIKSKWEDVKKIVAEAKAAGKKVAVILSSIIHEVYHYSDPQQTDRFWADVFGAEFDYIIIRDMIPSDTIDRVSCPNDVAKVLRKYRNSKELKDFERRWGSIYSNKNLIHFLLKYKYIIPNWEREVKENYIPLYHEDLMQLIPVEYDVLYHEHYPLPWLKRCVREDFGIELKDPTHLKIILERR